MGGGRRKAGLTGATARATSSSGEGRGGGGESVVTAGEESGGSVAGAVAAMVKAWRRRAEVGYCIQAAARVLWNGFFSLKPITGRQFTGMLSFVYDFLKEKNGVLLVISQQSNTRFLSTSVASFLKLCLQ